LLFYNLYDNNTIEFLQPVSFVLHSKVISSNQKNGSRAMKDNDQIEAKELAMWDRFAELDPTIGDIITFRNACNHRAAQDAAHLAILCHPDHDDHHVIMVIQQTYGPAKESPAKARAIATVMADSELKARNLTLLMRANSGVSEQITEEVLTAEHPDLDGLIHIAYYWESLRERAVAKIKAGSYSIQQIVDTANRTSGSTRYGFIGEIILANPDLTICSLRHAARLYPIGNLLQALFDHPQATIGDVEVVYARSFHGALQDRARTRIMAECPEKRAGILTGLIINRRREPAEEHNEAADQLINGGNIGIEQLRTILNVGNLPLGQANQLGRTMLRRKGLTMHDFGLILSGAPALKEEVELDGRYKKLSIIAAVGKIER
jgi:hypothetical protein